MHSNPFVGRTRFDIDLTTVGLMPGGGSWTRASAPLLSAGNGLTVVTRGGQGSAQERVHARRYKVLEQ